MNRRRIDRIFSPFLLNRRNALSTAIVVALVIIVGSAIILFSHPNSNDAVIAPTPLVITQQEAPHVRPVIPILLFTFNRAANLQRTVESLLRYRPSDGYPLIISQDGTDEAVTAVATSFTDRVSHLRYEWRGVAEPPHPAAYFHIAGNYHFGLTHVFDSPSSTYRAVNLMEDDMEIAPDFYDYFETALPILERDPTLLCASAWNDNGRRGLVGNATQLYRTECFPGLGWLMTRALWDELKPKWPRGFWDDWLREPPNRRERSCIIPEINRVYTFGSVGTSGGQFFSEYLADIQLNTQLVDWAKQDLSYIASASAYDTWIEDILRRATTVSSDSAARALIDSVSSTAAVPDLIVTYNNLAALTAMIKPLNLIADHKAGVPRTSYKGVLFYRYKARRIFLVHNNSPLIT